MTSGIDLSANESLPRRSIAPGREVGLSLMLNVEESEYYCTGTESVGFKVNWKHTDGSGKPKKGL